MNRQQAIITLAKINRQIKSLNYLQSLGSQAISEDALPMDLDQLSTWAEQLREYWNSNQDQIFAQAIHSIGSSDSVHWILDNLDLSGDLPGVLSSYLETAQDLALEVDAWQNQEKGKYWMLPEILATDEAAKLLTRAIDGGFLDQSYQPTEGTQLAHLKLIAYAVAKILELPVRSFWKPFCVLWGNDDLKSAYVPRMTRKDIIALSELYPEVDLSQAPNRRKQ